MTKKKVSALLLAGAMLLGASGGLIDVASAGGPAQGEARVDVRSEVAVTDVEGVYKVTLTAEGWLEAPSTGIAFVVDKSASMGNETPSKMEGVKSAISGFINTVFDGKNNAGWDRTYIGAGFYAGAGSAELTGTNPLGGVHFSTSMNDHQEKENLKTWINAVETAPGNSMLTVAQNAYRWMNDPAAATGVTGLDFDRKYVIVMGDGGDDNSVQSIEYFEGLKSPVGYTTPKGYAGQGAAVHVIGVQIAGYTENWAHYLGSDYLFKRDWAFYTGDDVLKGGEQHYVNIAAHLDTYPTAVYSSKYADVNNFYAANATITGENVQANYQHAKNASEMSDHLQTIAASIAADAFVEAKVVGQFSSAFQPYQMPGLPLVEVTSEDGEHNKAGKVAVTADGVEWVFNTLSPEASYSCVFYVKMRDGLDAGLQHLIFDSFHLRYTAKDGEINEKILANAYSIPSQNTSTPDVPAPDVTPDGNASEEGSASGDANTVVPPNAAANNDRTVSRVAASASDYSDEKTARQKDEDDDGSRLYTNAAGNIAPRIVDLRTGTTDSGRVKVIVELENGRYLRYQWQELVEGTPDGWADIFGATGSQYVLGGRFRPGRTYMMRCRITNPAGVVSYTATIEVTAAGGTNSGERLQRK